MKQGGVSAEIVFNYYLPSVGLVIYGCRRDFVAGTTHESPVPDLHTHNHPPPHHQPIRRYLIQDGSAGVSFYCDASLAFFAPVITASSRPLLFMISVVSVFISEPRVGLLRFALLLECFMTGFPLYWPAARRSREYCSSYGSRE